MRYLAFKSIFNVHIVDVVHHMKYENSDISKILTNITDSEHSKILSDTKTIKCNIPVGTGKRSLKVYQASQYIQDFNIEFK